MTRNDRLLIATAFVGILVIVAMQVGGRQLAIAGLPFGAIGRLDDADGFCTATVVGEHTLLTAAHCVRNADGAIRLPERFTAGLERTDSVAVATPTDSYVPPPLNDKDDTGDDWALVYTVEPLGKRTGILPVMPAAELRRHLEAQDLEFLHVGYGRFDGARVTVQRGCRVLDLGEDGSIEHYCSAVPGDSGGPLLARDRAGRWQIVGITSRSRFPSETEEVEQAVDARAFVDAVAARSR